MDCVSSGAGTEEADGGQRIMKRKVYHAILNWDFKQANVLLASALLPVHNREWLRDLRIRDKPLLHYLAGLEAFLEQESTQELDRFVKFCVSVGLDIEQPWPVGPPPTLGVYCTALGAAILGKNGVLAESLVRAGGANVNAVGGGPGGERLFFNVLHYFSVMNLSHGVWDIGDSLLKTFLNSGRLEINVRNKSGESPVSYLLRELSSQCPPGWRLSSCRTADPECQPKVFKLLTLLLQHGADVSGLEIGSETRYHWGYGPLIKLLYAAGAKVKTEGVFMEGLPCSWGYHGSRAAFLREVEELREWISIEGERKMRLDLKFHCRVVIRSSVRRAGDLQKLTRLAPPLRDYVAMKEELKGVEASLEAK